VKLEDAKTLQQEMRRAEAEKEEQRLRKQKVYKIFMNAKIDACF
jgi:hypothetical protein